MEIYNVSYKTPSGVKQRGTISAFTLEDAKETIKAMVRVDNDNRFFDCTILRVWKNQPPSPKQQLAQKYGFIVGSVAGAQAQFRHAYLKLKDNAPVNNQDRLYRAIALVDSQFAKLQRDIKDCFKLAGLKVK